MPPAVPSSRTTSDHVSVGAPSTSHASSTVDGDDVYQRVSARAYFDLLLYYLRPHKGRVAWLAFFGKSAFK